MSDETTLRRHTFTKLLELYTDFVARELFDDDNKLKKQYADLERYFPYSINEEQRNSIGNADKVKIFFELIKMDSSKEDADSILNFMENIKYGWVGGRYRLSNHCLIHGANCKRNFKIDSDPRETTKAFDSIHKIFLDDKELRGIVTYLFGYCITALFSSLLKHSGMRVPFFLQIACERNSNLYRLIHEIVDICDVNTGLLQSCDKVLSGYGYCDYDYETVFPTRNVDKELEELLCHRDVPVIIDGYESEKLYADLIREVANIPSRKRLLHYKDRFRILPIFICSTIKSRFKNVLTMDLNGLEVSDEYLELIKGNKQRLASWVFELVNDFWDYVPMKFPKGRLTPHEEWAIHRGTKNKTPLFDMLSSHINDTRKNNRHFTELNPRDIENIGHLSFFFELFMEVFKRSINLPPNTHFLYQGRMRNHNTSELVNSIVNKSVDHLLNLHKDYSSSLIEKATVTTRETDPLKAKRIIKKGEELASGIVNYYLSYGVSIKVLPDVEYADERYVFVVALLPGTDVKLINRYADEVRRLLGMEFMWVSKEQNQIKISLSDKTLKDVDLIKMLESKKFEDYIIKTDADKKDKTKMMIPYAVGYDVISREMVIADIKEFPHLIVGGATGYGKSSALHSLIMSIVYKQSPDRVRIMLLDFGASKLNKFEDTPHMLGSLVQSHEVEKGYSYLLALLEEVARREYIINNNEKELDKLPSIVCVVDEFPTFIEAITSGKGNKNNHKVIKEILHRARKTKIHMILAATSSTKLNIGINMTNFSAGIAFKCNDWRDSKSIIGITDAEHLTSRGSMYFKSYLSNGGPARLQGAYIEPDDIKGLLDSMNPDYSRRERFRLAWVDEPRTLNATDGYGETDNIDNVDNEVDSQAIPPVDSKEKKLADIIMWTLSRDKFSNNKIKKIFGMGYDVADRFLRDLEKYGIVSELREGTKLPRVVIPKTYEDLSAEVVNLLERCKYTKEKIMEAISKRPSTQTTQA